nr:Chain B, La-related protein 4 [synthetic construct]
TGLNPNAKVWQEIA